MEKCFVSRVMGEVEDLFLFFLVPGAGLCPCSPEPPLLIARCDRKRLFFGHPLLFGGLFFSVLVGFWSSTDIAPFFSKSISLRGLALLFFPFSYGPPSLLHQRVTSFSFSISRKFLLPPLPTLPRTRERVGPPPSTLRESKLPSLV